MPERSLLLLLHLVVLLRRTVRRLEKDWSDCLQLTPARLPPRVLDFSSFVMGYVLTFRVIPLIGGALIQVPGLLQGTLGPNSVLLHPWSMKLQVMLDTPTGRRSLNTSCVSVDTCWNLTLCMSWLTIITRQSTNGKIPPCRTGLLLQDGGIVVWNLLGLTRRTQSFSFSPFLRPPGCIMCTPLGRAPLSWLFSLDSTLCCLTVIVCLSLCLRLQIFGQRPFWPGSLLIQMVDSLRCTHCLLSNASAQTVRLSAHSIVSAVREWDRVHLWSLSRTLSLMLDWLWYFVPLTPPYLIGRPGHSALGVHQRQFQMWSSEKRHLNLRWPSGARWVNFWYVRAPAVSSVMRKRPYGFNLDWRSHL